MGFKIPKSVVVLEFDESSVYRGAEIAMSLDISLGRALEMQNQMATPNPEKIVELLGELVVNWNLEDDEGQPLPVSEDSIRDFVPLPLMLEIFKGYQKGMEGLMSVDVPLGIPSKDGDT